MTNKLADYLKSCDYTVNVSYRDMGRNSLKGEYFADVSFERS